VILDASRDEAEFLIMLADFVAIQNGLPPSQSK
jgi:hypothetical protein